MPSGFYPDNGIIMPLMFDSFFIPANVRCD